MYVVKIISIGYLLEGEYFIDNCKENYVFFWFV